MKYLLKTFRGILTAEEGINKQADMGYRPIAVTQYNGVITVLFEKTETEEVKKETE